MQKINLRKGDLVEVITGTDKGKTGKIIQVDRKKGRLYIQGVNMRKKHRRRNPQKNVPGGIIEMEGPIHPSNVRPVK